MRVPAQASFLLAGDFTVSFTCNADAEDVNADDDLKFVETQDIVVIVGETGTVNFPASVP